MIRIMVSGYELNQQCTAHFKTNVALVSNRLDEGKF